MDSGIFSTYKIEDRSYVSYIRRELHNLLKTVFSEIRTGEADIVIAELTSNLVKFAGRGEILYRFGKEDQDHFFEIICLDKGPGMVDVPHSARDGYSTHNTLGHGIGSIFRLSSVAQIYSQPDWGTVVYVKIKEWSAEPFISHKKSTAYTFSLPKPGEKVCGDAVSIKHTEDKTYILVADGLGHGPHAKEAVDAAIVAFQHSNLNEASLVISDIDTKVRKTRGLVATVAILDHIDRQWQICGVGNILTRVNRGLESKNYICNNGIIGLNIPTRLQNYVFEQEKYQLLIMCSDGLRTRWDLLKYKDLLKYDPMLIAAVLYKDHNRGTDDLTIFIMKVQ